MEQNLLKSFQNFCGIFLQGSFSSKDTSATKDILSSENFVQALLSSKNIYYRILGPGTFVLAEIKVSKTDKSEKFPNRLWEVFKTLQVLNEVPMIKTSP